jgi:hypothetical protein
MSKSSSHHPTKKTGTARHAPTKGAGNERQTSENVAVAAKKDGTHPAPAPLSGKTLTREAARQKRNRAERQMRSLVKHRARRKRLLIWTSALLLCAVIGGIAIYFLAQSHGAIARTGSAPYTEPIFDNAYPPIDNVYCDQLEMQAAHIHAHLSIWINGHLSALPQGIGIPIDPQSGQATCFYWLHTHDSTGVIHIEAPVQETLTLGQFFDEWNQQFQSLGFPSQLLLTSGWTSWVNGHPSHGSITSIALTSHALITLAFNSPNAKPDTTYAWNGL